MSRHLLIDADVLVYRHAHAEQCVIEWSHSLHTTHAFLDPAKKKLTEYLDGLLETLEADVLTCVLSDVDGNFRKDVYSQYKAARGGTSRPILYKPLREFFFEEYSAIMEPRLEGDDLLGLYATGPAFAVAGADEMVICTIDKDLGTVPGLHFNFNSPNTGVYEISQTVADYNFLTQTLTGDSTDGYPGCPGIGPVKAERILQDMDRAPWPLLYGWHRVVETYVKAGLNENVALTQARCARILRGDEYDFENHQEILWEPPVSPPCLKCGDRWTAPFEGGVIACSACQEETETCG